VFMEELDVIISLITMFWASRFKDK